MSNKRMLPTWKMKEIDRSLHDIHACAVGNAAMEVLGCVGLQIDVYDDVRKTFNKDPERLISHDEIYGMFHDAAKYRFNEALKKKMMS